jgi:hypothetical protein
MEPVTSKSKKLLGKKAEMLVARDKLTPVRREAVGGELPTVKTMSKGFWNSMKTWAKEGFETVTPDIIEHRLSICRGCELWDEDARLGFGKCNHTGCGCTKLKLWLPHESCPLKKWTSVSDSEKIHRVSVEPDV